MLYTCTCTFCCLTGALYMYFNITNNCPFSTKRVTIALSDNILSFIFFVLMCSLYGSRSCTKARYGIANGHMERGVCCRGDVYIKGKYIF